jgi:hypothetical protein
MVSPVAPTRYIKWEPVEECADKKCTQKHFEWEQEDSIKRGHYYEENGQNREACYLLYTETLGYCDGTFGYYDDAEKFPKPDPNPSITLAGRVFYNIITSPLSIEGSDSKTFLQGFKAEAVISKVRRKISDCISQFVYVPDLMRIVMDYLPPASFSARDVAFVFSEGFPVDHVDDGNLLKENHGIHLSKKNTHHRRT